MSKTIRNLFIGVILAGLVLSACTPAPTAAPEPTKAPPTAVPATDAPEPTAVPTEREVIKLKIAVLPYISNAPLFIAQAEGYYEEQGLDVELVEFTTSSEILPALLSRQIDIGANALAVGMFNAVADGNNVKYVADKGFYNPENCVTDGFVISATLAAAGEPTADTIKGKVMVFPPGDTFEYIADTLLASYGLTQADVTPTFVADNVARVDGLKNGSIDISMLSEPFLSRSVAEAGTTVQWPLAKIVPGLSGAMMAFGPSVLDDNPEAGVRFMVAYLKAVKKFNEGKTDRNIEMLSAFTKLDADKVKAACWTSFKADGMIDTDGMMAFQEWGLAKKYINSPIELDQIWTAEFLEQAMALLP